MRIETSSLEHLEENKDGANLRCVSDSNPPATVLWRKEGHEGVFQAGAEISFSPVTRKTAGLYSCTAENALGMSKPAFIEVDVKCKQLHYLLSVGVALTNLLLLRLSVDPVGRPVQSGGGSRERKDDADV